MSPYLLLAWIVPALVQAPSAAPSAEGRTGKRVLVYTVSAGYQHDVVKREEPDWPSLVETALVDLGKRTGHFEAVPTRDAGAFERASLAKFDLVFFYTTGELPLSAEQRKALFEFVKKGGAFAGAHCATDTFYKVPEYGEMIGAYFDDHPWHQEVRVRVEDREHPATAHLGEGFSVVDEIYQFKAPYDRKSLHVLLSLDLSSVDPKAKAVHRTDGDFALAWCKDYDKGRVFYTALGHEPALWKDERYLAMLDGGFRWAMRMTEHPAGAGAPEGRKDENREPRPKEPGKDGSRTKDEDGAQKPPGKPSPIVPDEFAIDLVAEAPQILWPSSNTCLPDGSLLVGEDRMDMPGPTSEPLDRVIELRWKADGSFEKTIFAEKLFAVMGMAEVDGAVYVMNMPHLTRLVDKDGDGVADEREEILTDLGAPAPGFPGGFNDHIVSGIRLGMDGFLYVAVGDKGIPGAHGTDGRTLQLRGGGVVRVRPDGSGLDVVATGLRNVLDVAIDERGEMFTYDNTDDGLGWWTRLTHVVAGGYYGYPWDYHDHRERMLPCMAEYGGGSPTGGLVYRESAWPAEFQGNLFFCEWGKGALRRFILEPDGSTFRVNAAEDFVKAGDVPAFKPLDVCESPDGRFLYLSDWGYEGWTNPKEAGRIWRIRRADDDPRKPSVAKPLPQDADGLVRSLADPSFGFRLRAQRELARRGEAVLPQLRSALTARDLLGRRARHALWAREEIGGDSWSSDLALALGGEPELARQAAKAFCLRPSDDLAPLESFLDRAEAPARRDGVLALGRCSESQRSAAERMLIRYLSVWSQGEDLFLQDPFLRSAWTASMRRVGKRFDFSHTANPAVAIEPLRGTYEPEAVDDLIRALGNRIRPDARTLALAALADLYRRPEPWDGQWWGIQPAKTPPPPHVVEWKCTPRIEKAVLASLDDVRREVRRAALEALRTMDDRAALPAVRARWEREGFDEVRVVLLDVLGALKDEDASGLLDSVIRAPGRTEELRAHAIEAACAIRTPSMVDLLASLAADPTAPAARALPCLAALARLKEPRTARVVRERIRAGDEKIRVAAIAAVVDIEGAEAASGLEPLLGDSSISVRLAALRAFRRLKLREETPKLLALVDDEETRDEAICALAAVPDSRALQAYLLGLAHGSKAAKDASRLAIAEVREDVRQELEAMCRQRRFDEIQLAAIQSIYRDLQPLLDWRVLGPFARGREPELAREPLDFGRKHAGASGVEVAWIEHRASAPHGFVNLAKLCSKSSEVSAFAAGEVRSAADREAEMAVGSDDSVSVYVNGELVHEFAGNRSWTADEDCFRVKLHTGTNSILLLVANATGGWSFNAKIAGEESGPLFERKASGPDPGAYRQYVLGHRGDPARGFALFRRSRDESMCIRCHTVFGVGDAVGPELSDVGAKYGREEILESILAPSQRIAEGYRSSAFELQDGRVLFGMVRKETKDTIEIFDTNGVLQVIETADVASRRQLDTSVMPDGLWSTLSQEDLCDLVDWLVTLRGSPGAK